MGAKAAEQSSEGSTVRRRVEGTMLVRHVDFRVALGRVGHRDGGQSRIVRASPAAARRPMNGVVRGLDPRVPCRVPLVVMLGDTAPKRRARRRRQCDPLPLVPRIAQVQILPESIRRASCWWTSPLMAMGSAWRYVRSRSSRIGWIRPRRTGICPVPFGKMPAPPSDRHAQGTEGFRGASATLDRRAVVRLAGPLPTSGEGR